MPVQLGYWNIRAVRVVNIFDSHSCLHFVLRLQFAQPIRLLLAYTGTEFEDTRYSWKHVADNEFDSSEWLDVKFTLGLDFPNVLQTHPHSSR